ncbi:MAG: ribbon-helix-helix domain-containing protein [Clostridiales bacterium]|nr:ribbon-helix-helix domain-containing protein [Clostridiales bacterium]
MGYNELKYRQRFTTSIDKNILKAFFELSEIKKQPKSWLMDEALEDLLRKNGVEVQKASDKKG